MQGHQVQRINGVEYCEWVARSSSGAHVCNARITKIGTAGWTVKASTVFHGSSAAARVFATVLQTAANEADRRNGHYPGEAAQ